MSDTPATPTTPSMIDQLSQRFPNATLIRMGKDGIPSITVPRADWVATVRALRDEFKCQRFVDVTATDDPDLEERFEVHCFIGRAYEPVWFHIRTRTAHLCHPWSASIQAPIGLNAKCMTCLVYILRDIPTYAVF